MRYFATSVLFMVLFLDMSAQELSSVIEFGQSFPHVSGARIEALSDGSFIHFDAIFDDLDIDPGTGILQINGAQSPGNVVSRFDAEGNLIWSNYLPTGSYGFGGISLTPTEDILVSGNFTGTVDFDPSSNDYSISSASSNDIYIACYHLDGSLNWAKNIEGSWMNTYSVPYAITSDTNGNAIVVGYFSNTADFDPGADEYYLNSYDGDIDAFILKLDQNGEFVFANAFGGEMYDYINQVSTDSDDGIVVKGTLRSFMDLDPGTNEFLLSSQDDFETGFVAKYDAGGGFIWAFALSTNASAGIESHMLNVDLNGDVVIAGLSYSYCDFDPGEGEAIISGEDIYWYLVKYSGSGDFVWLKNGLGAITHCAAIDSDGNIYTSGFVSSNGDLDGGLGTFYPDSENDVSLFCAKYSGSGDFVWGFGLGGSQVIGDSWTTDSDIDADGNLVIAGLYQSNLDVDPGEGTTALTAIPNAWPLFVATYSQSICSNTSMIITEVENLSCNDYTGMLSAEFTNGAGPFSFQWNTGETTSTIEATQIGFYTVTGTDTNGCEVDRDIIVNGPSTSDNFDLNPNAMAWNFSPGFDTQIQLDAFNAGCVYTSGSVILTLDSVLTVVDVSPPADNISGNVITWDFANINYDSEHLTPSVTVNTPVQTALGDIMNLTVEMTPSTGDFFINNNIKNYEYEVVGSYDPNIIEVYPKGTGDEGYINANETMTYTIHFQNTGTAPAVNVDVLDVIDADLNINTVQVIGSSHAMHTEVENGNTLRFVFNDIMLPDSTNNEPESHGYVIYTIDQQPNLPFYTQMENTAAIYFDFNAPVITNTVLNTIEGPLVVDEGALNNAVQLYPNPASSMLTINCGNSKNNVILIIAMDGRTVNSFKTRQSQIQCDVTALSAGVYEVRVLDENGNAKYNRFVKK